MARVKEPPRTIENTFFATPEQKVARFLMTESTTTFSIRVLSSRLKGVRGLGGAEGILKILGVLEEIGWVDFVDNRRGVRLRDDNPAVQLLKSFGAICDLEGLGELLRPLSSKGVLFGPRADGLAHSESEYDLFVISDRVAEVRTVVAGHPIGKQVRLEARTPTQEAELERREPALARQLAGGITLWKSGW
jgi:hypothetical protein